MMPDAAGAKSVSAITSCLQVASHGEPPMLSNPLQYYPQNLGPQNLGLPFSGPQAAGWPQQIGAGLGQPGAYNGTAQFGQADGQAGFGLPAANPYLQNQWQSPVAYNPLHNP